MHRAIIDLDKSKDAEDRIVKFADFIFNGGTVFSASGLLYSLLTDLDMVIES